MGGKVKPELLERLVFRYLGAEPKRLLLGPSLGEDAAAIDFGDEKLVVHTDPITGARELVGWLAVHVPCNDVATTGADPLWLSIAMLIPSDSGVACLERVVKDVDEAAKSIGVSIVGGHTEFVDGLTNPLLVATCMGVAKRIVPTSGARVGDIVIATKSIALEGTAILATDFERELLEKEVPKEVIDRAKGFYRLVSVVNEARILREYATSMHDPTEGGLIGGLLEVAKASRVKIVVYEDRVPVEPETIAICRAMKVDYLKLISSGCLVATIPKPLVSKALEDLARIGVRATVIGEVVDGEGVELVKKSGEKLVFSEWVDEELYRLLSEH